MLHDLCLLVQEPADSKEEDDDSSSEEDAQEKEEGGDVEDDNKKDLVCNTSTICAMWLVLFLYDA